MKVVLGLPWSHVLGETFGEGALSGLLHGVLILEPEFDLVVLLIILLVLLEHLWVLSQILLIRYPRSINAILVMVYIFQVEVYSSHVVMVHSMLNVLEVLMGGGETEFKQLLVHSLLWILELISELISLSIKLFSERHLRHFIVDLGQLLHLEVVLADQVLLLLGEVPQVSGGRPSIDLT